MRIRFARYEQRSKGYTVGFWLCLIVGGLTAVSSGEHGTWVAEVLLAGAFVCLWGIMAARIRNDYGQQEFEDEEISSDEYIALNARLGMYPEAKEELAEVVPGDGRVTYGLAYSIEELVNRHAYGIKALRDEEVREQARGELITGIGKA